MVVRQYFLKLFFFGKCCGFFVFLFFFNVGVLWSFLILRMNGFSHCLFITASFGLALSFSMVDWLFTWIWLVGLFPLFLLWLVSLHGWFYIWGASLTYWLLMGLTMTWSICSPQKEQN